MAAPEEPPKHSGISAQLFELLKVCRHSCGLLGSLAAASLTIIRIGSHQGGSRTRKGTRNGPAIGADLFCARSATFSNNAGIMLFRLFTRSATTLRPRKGIKRGRITAPRSIAWNIKWNLYRALVSRTISGPICKNVFYDEESGLRRSLGKKNVRLPAN